MFVLPTLFSFISFDNYRDTAARTECMGVILGRRIEGMSALPTRFIYSFI
jgi:hypothetical protein